MIVAGLMGGIGNQLFQYSVGRRLSLKLGTELRLDPSFLRRDHGPELTNRPFLLDRLEIESRVIAPDELEEFLDAGMSSLRRTVNDASMKLLGRRPLPNPRVFRERDKNFEPGVLDLPDDRYLYGYYQSELYFQDIRDVLLKDLRVRGPMNDANSDLAAKIGEGASVCLHVRRGDYYSNPAARMVHAVDLTDYYRKAISLMKERVGDCHFFLFSDEPEWVKANFDLGDACTVVDVNTPLEPEQDLRLMSLCEHFIIANSTFSWWGAWLSQNPDKVVIAPERWFLDDRNIKDRCPKGWIRI